MKASHFTDSTLLYLFCVLILLGCGGGSSNNNQTSNTPIANSPPEASAGVAQSVGEHQVVTLNASASSDTDGSISSYQWSQSAGTAVALSGSDIAMPTFTSPMLTASETLTFQVTVTDNDGATASATVNIMVEHLNLAPTTDAGEDQSVDKNTEVQLSGTLSSDPDGSISQYLWTQPAGDYVTLSDHTAVEPSFAAPDGESVTTLTLSLW